MTDLIYADITYKIRGACFEVWKKFGGAFKEKIVDNALTIALKEKQLTVKNQEKINIYFNNIKVGTYIPDKIVDDIILLEIKCKPFITIEDRKQFWYYLKASQYKLGLLINFGTQKLQIERRVYDMARNKIPKSSASLSA
ncbi:GxxExxY protein [Candidatus Roizmanbacteria bacterium CG06_land_8_20_14_3_00_34_14]|uniref:GxxExxY protein n=2 Tax=Candidatus Roizmaniibacteriota TaxID=1752723 RepID=A0A2M7AVL5_9BACT|nr:MAG: GxxExxY protein [Candidatus Roizmanbacteria bacterium CG07_land_8_20_14_0_80_34_15]PIU74619.1 MAG: GxxExxY protein [Candidatus Roizmanbacteria bacterium CG06_land_8_20_14_3_00_34_14]